MRLSLNINGFGVAVVQRLCKTSAKKNLYWEIKDKVIEEQFDGTRNIKRTAKVKVYGFDSNKKERARLIEILFERVRYHKDKFIIPILHQEMCGMQWKKDRVDHSDETHDDNIFSYLMALHVWYDGNDVLERYNIRKNTIKTDEDVEIVDGDIDASLEKKDKLDLHELEYDIDDDHADLQSAYQFIAEAGEFKTAAQLKEETYLAETRQREAYFLTNHAARDAYCKQHNINPEMYANTLIGIDKNTVTLPYTLFGGVGDELDTMDYSDDPLNPRFNPQNGEPNLVGNLSHLWNQL